MSITHDRLRLDSSKSSGTGQQLTAMIKQQIDGLPGEKKKSEYFTLRSDFEPKEIAREDPEQQMPISQNRAEMRGKKLISYESTLSENEM